jgi:hypothetical protein
MVLLNHGDGVVDCVDFRDGINVTARVVLFRQVASLIVAVTKAHVAYPCFVLLSILSVHIWQAWAVYEESKGDIPRARQLYEKALELDAGNPYVNHAFGLMEKKLGNTEVCTIVF